MGRSEAQKYLMSKEIALDPTIVDTVEAINKHRSIDYLQEGVFEFNEAQEPIKIKQSCRASLHVNCRVVFCTLAIT